MTTSTPKTVMEESLHDQKRQADYDMAYFDRLPDSMKECLRGECGIFPSHDAFYLLKLVGEASALFTIRNAVRQDYLARYGFLEETK